MEFLPYLLHFNDRCMTYTSPVLSRRLRYVVSFEVLSLTVQFNLLSVTDAVSIV